MKTRVHSFESFGTVDGPGIRFVIFFQGCHLQCRYCHNRDLWPMKNTNETTEYTTKELLEEIEKYEPFFRHSKGGVTASGGDPILQAKPITELFGLCKKKGIHTALDTSGIAPLTDNVRDLLDVTDLVLLDLKHINEEKHKILTGASNRLSLDFARYLSEINKPTWVRYVVVPGYSDDVNDVQEMATFLQGLNSIEKVELLPYHIMGEHKWEMMGEEYPLKGVNPPSIEKIAELKAIFENAGLEAISSL